ncbi:uncharacterized protein KQ657_003423 [Scheffersomyces spartinae]|uniref:Thioredoxin-like protein n=1 Tax=Scheffersomyces spartinae TaxID=45513 RepID=A0A9P7VDT9_9ASCO|nr:uncharacterized protein KQ657_003423 [Scheffersomyces spartinae]KAG7195653.1 hypothetical protein KQ657_003423 [Scheffersomyces spartinae]
MYKNRTTSKIKLYPFPVATKMDSKQSEIVEQFQQSILRPHEEEEVDSDDLVELLDEDDSVMAQYRAQRIQQLSSHIKEIRHRQAQDSDELGQVRTIEKESDLMALVTKEDKVLVHFYQPDFVRCKTMNEKLELIAEKHLELMVVVIKAENAPFLANKLHIKQLPFVVGYIYGKLVLKLLGFEQLGNNPNDFPIQVLENHLLRANLIKHETINHSRALQRGVHDSDSEDFDI